MRSCSPSSKRARRLPLDRLTVSTLCTAPRPRFDQRLQETVDASAQTYLISRANTFELTSGDVREQPKIVDILQQFRSGVTHLSGPNTSGCIDGGVTTDQTFTIDSLSSNGSGTAGLSCGSGCGWVFRIQVAPNHQIANLTDVDTANPYNTPTGTMIRQ